MSAWTSAPIKASSTDWRGALNSPLALILGAVLGLGGGGFGCAAKTVAGDLGEPVAAEGFDLDRARISGPNQFKPLVVKGEGVLLSEAGLKGDDQLIIVERGSERRAFRVVQMAYHHVAQGELDGEPYIVAF